MGLYGAKIYTVKGFTGTRNELADHFGINPRTLQTRLRSGMSLEAALTTPVNKEITNKFPAVLTIGEFTGDTYAVEGWFGLNLNQKERLNSGFAIERIKRPGSVKFYNVGSYKGTLRAISKAFDCPISLLRQAVDDGKKLEDVLKEGGYLTIGEKK